MRILIFFSLTSALLRVTDETQNIKNQLYKELQKSATLEQFWQKKLERATGLHHERLDHGLITDLSDWHVLIEIKNGQGFREAFGQIAVYSHLKAQKGCSKDLKKIIVIFNADWAPKMREDYKQICEKAGVILVHLTDRNLATADFEPLLRHLRLELKQINFRERMEKYRHRQTLKEFLLRE